MDLILDQTAKELLVNKGFDEKFGARPLRRAIQKYVEDPLAEEILNYNVKEGDILLADLDKEKVALNFTLQKKEKEKVPKTPKEPTKE